MQFDLIVVPDPVLAKYLVESFFEKEAKVAKKKAYYEKLSKQPFGVIDNYPPKERYEYQRIKELSKQKWIRKFPPIATCGKFTFLTPPYNHLPALLHPNYHPSTPSNIPSQDPCGLPSLKLLPSLILLPPLLLSPSCGIPLYHYSPLSTPPPTPQAMSPTND